MTPQIEILLVAIFISISCVIPGTLLVLRKVSLLTDSISHSILLGIVGTFLFLKDLHSPWLFFGAVLISFLCVFITEQLIHLRFLRKDASVAVVFPAFFSLALLLISLFASDAHLDIDMVILGELAFAPFNRLVFQGVDFGPFALWTGIGALALNLLFLLVFYKECKLVIFDKTLALLLGFSPIFLHYATVVLASITVVSAFDAVGVVLVIGFMVVPPSTALLVTKDFKKVLMGAVLVGVLASIFGYRIANLVDASIAGSITVVMGLIFFFTLLFSPSTGLLRWGRFRWGRYNEMKRNVGRIGNKEGILKVGDDI